MQCNNPSSLYQQALDAGECQPDEIQCQAIARLDVIYQRLGQLTAASPARSKKLRERLSHFLGKKPAPLMIRPVRGLYMWGGVGRGKTWLMDMFFHSLPGDRKLRLHFHRFMLRVHEELTQLQGHENPLYVVADGFKIQTDILCFDEFFVSDITDAMILGTLLEALFARGITLVATSNILPDKLYHNGLQRARFLPAIELIKQYCDIMNVDSGVDYRLRTLANAPLYLTPLNEQTHRTMKQLFVKLAGKEGKKNVILEINHRPMLAVCVAGGVLAIDFHTLCEESRSQLDYIVLSKFYHSVLLHNVRCMGSKDENTARRFLALIDEFYERRVKLVISAEVIMTDLYRGRHLNFEYQRCLSRLQEMQSQMWLQLPHLP